MDDYQWEMSTLSGENATTKQVTQRAINKRQGFTNARQPPFYNANPSRITQVHPRLVLCRLFKRRRHRKTYVLEAEHDQRTV
jgi:hypothetical protein